MKTARIDKAASFLVAGLAAGVLALAGQAQKPEWKGKVLTEEGVRVVVNPAEPLYGEIGLDLEEELRIGKEGDDRAQFYRVRDVGADERGNIYVVDMSNNRVQVFDPAGAYLRTIGRAGQGPGEFDMPTLVRFGGPAGHTLVLDRFRRVNAFDDKGVFVRSILVDGSSRTFFTDGAGGLFVITTTGGDEDLNPFHNLCRLGDDGRTRSVLAKFPYTLHMERREGATMSVSTGFELSLWAAPLPGRALVYGYSKGYELVVLGPDDKRLLVIRKEGRRPEFTSAEKAEFGRVAVPEYKPFFFGIIADQDGRIYVQRNFNALIKRNFGPMATEDKQVDVFGREGRFLFRTALPPNTRVIRGDLIFTYFVDEDEGLEYVQRFRIRNYAALPKE